MGNIPGKGGHSDDLAAIVDALCKVGGIHFGFEFLGSWGTKSDKAYDYLEAPTSTYAPSVLNAAWQFTEGFVRDKAVLPPVFDKPGIKVFFATEREALSGDGAKYGPNRDPHMQMFYGYAVVQISRKPGLLDPDDLRIYRDQNYRRGLSRPLDENTFYALVRDEIARTAPNSKQVFVFVHGFNNSFEEEINKAAEIAYDTRFVGVPILFDWPSGTYSKNDIVPGYNNDFRSALESADHLARFLKDLSEKPGVARVNIVAHSMGSYLLLEALDRLQIGKILPHFGQLILAAPDVQEVRFQQVMTKLTSANAFDHITLYGSRNDYAMWASEKANSRPPVGMLKPILNIAGLDQVDISKLTQNGIGHDYIVSARAVYAAVSATSDLGFTAPSHHSFPIVLLLQSPLTLVISAAVPPTKARPYMIVALLALLLGTASLFVATSTGEAAGELAQRGGAMKAVLESHEELASETRIIFSILSAILVRMFVLPIVLPLGSPGSFRPSCLSRFLPYTPWESCSWSIPLIKAAGWYTSLEYMPCFKHPAPRQMHRPPHPAGRCAMIRIRIRDSRSAPRPWLKIPAKGIALTLCRP
jgi:esterase/lipase superfamily enzyme